MLSNEYFLAKFRFDTPENEPAKNLQNFRKMHLRTSPYGEYAMDAGRGGAGASGGSGEKARTSGRTAAAVRIERGPRFRAWAKNGLSRKMLAPNSKIYSFKTF